MEAYQDYSNVKVGDRVWWSDINQKRGDLATGVVSKVGSKLITVLSQYNWTIVFRKDTGRTNDAYEHQSLIVSKDLYEAAAQANKVFNCLRNSMHRREDGVTYADILEAAKLLKIEIKEE